MDRLKIDVNKLPLETYTQLIMIKEVNNFDTLEEVVAMLADYFYYGDEREDN